MECLPEFLLIEIFQWLWQVEDFPILSNIKTWNKSWALKMKNMQYWWKFIWENLDLLHNVNRNPHEILWWIHEAISYEKQPICIRFTGCENCDNYIKRNVAWKFFTRLKKIENMCSLFPPLDVKNVEISLHFDITSSQVSLQNFVRKLEYDHDQIDAFPLHYLALEYNKYIFTDKAAFYLFIYFLRHNLWKEFLNLSKNFPNYLNIKRLFHIIQENKIYKRKISHLTAKIPRSLSFWNQFITFCSTPPISLKEE